MSAIFTLRKKGLAKKQHIALIHANAINNNKKHNKYIKKYLHIYMFASPRQKVLICLRHKNSWSGLNMSVIMHWLVIQLRKVNNCCT